MECGAGFRLCEARSGGSVVVGVGGGIGGEVRREGDGTALAFSRMRFLDRSSLTF